MDVLPTGDWWQGRRIGKGAFSEIYEVRNINTGQACARKVFRPGTSTQADNEVRIMQRLRQGEGCANIVAFLNHGFLQPGGVRFIEMELCDVTLLTFLYGNARRSAAVRVSPQLPFYALAPSLEKTRKIWDIMRQVAEGVAYIHSFDFVHTNLGPDCVLYSKKDSLWKIAGFAAACEAHSSPTIWFESALWGPESRNVGFDLTPKFDIWSMGCILYELTVGSLPFLTQSDVYSHYDLKKQIEIPPDKTFGPVHNEAVTQVIRSMLQPRPASRPTAKALRDIFHVASGSPVGEVTESASTPNSPDVTTLTLKTNIDSDDERRLFKIVAQSTATSSWKFNLPDQIQQAPIPAKVRWIMGDQQSMAYCRLIAHGGFGEVHELYDIRGSLHFARKVIRAVGETVTHADIENEARAVDKLTIHGHPNIVSVLRHGWIDTSWYFIDMELCDMNLGTFIYENLDWDPYLCFDHPEFLHIEEPPVWWRTAPIFRILYQIANGLAFIHQQQQVHRDLKPQNVLHSKRQNCWKITDFGITTEGTATIGKTTTKGRGTECYRAPEVIMNEGSGRFSYKSDIWSLGCILYELFMTKKAYRNDWEVLGFPPGPTRASQRQLVLEPLDDAARPEMHCEVCHKHLELFENALLILRDTNPLLDRMLSKEAPARPSADDLKEIWQNWKDGANI